MHVLPRRTIASLIAVVAAGNAIGCPIQQAIYRDTSKASHGTAQFHQVRGPREHASHALTLKISFPRRKAGAAYDAWFLARRGETGRTELVENTAPGTQIWEPVENRERRMAAPYALEFFAWNDDRVLVDAPISALDTAPTYLLIPGLSTHVWDVAKRGAGSMFKLIACRDTSLPEES
ncbi:hypothetical protein L2Y96_14630 [Luteibacter aegosomaticola]|uniref:hypothetical protein n=1 Tax=Luteibacter aegosomaticola TaxID=2911538 RepID=UPI001FF9DB7D|nr:hypothetical protein [Luteibacter aegosomaticola]UPG88649.1 hypothetical protein L2Y96_14630 [Luteibacter aegosomaticola]